MSQLPYRRFLGANAAGGLIWGVLYALLGYYAGHALDSIERYSGWAASGLLVVVLALALGLHLRRRRRDARSVTQWRRDHPEDDLPHDLP